MPDAEPVFAEPWEAHAFALAVKLSEAGIFTWSEWSAALAEELAAASQRGESDDGSRYYHHWLAALERLAAEKNLVTAALCKRAKRRVGGGLSANPARESRNAGSSPSPQPSPRERGEERGPHQREGEGQPSAGISPAWPFCAPSPLSAHIPC